MRVVRYLGWANAFIYMGIFNSLILVYIQLQHLYILSTSISLMSWTGITFLMTSLTLWAAINEFVIDWHQHFVSDTVTFCRHRF